MHFAFHLVRAIVCFYNDAMGDIAVKIEESKEYLNEVEKQELGNYFGQLKKFGINFVSLISYISPNHTNSKLN